MENKQTLFTTNLFYFIIIFALLFVRTLFNTGIFDHTGEVMLETIWTILNQILIMGFLPLLLYFLSRRKESSTPIADTMAHFQFKRPSIKVIALTFVCGFFLIFVTMGISMLFQVLLTLTGYMPNISETETVYTLPMFLFAFLTTAVLPGICEEITHRGLLLNGYRALGDSRAVVYSAIMFGLMHMNIEQFFYATILGCIIGFVAIKSGSILPAMILHFMNNFMSVLLQYTSYPGGVGDYFNRFTELLFNNNYALFSLIAWIVVSVAVFGLFYIWLLKIIIRENPKLLDNHFPVLFPSDNAQRFTRPNYGYFQNPNAANGQNPYANYGQNPYGQDPFGNPNAANGQNPYGNYGQNPYGQDPFGNPNAANGQNPYANTYTFSAGANSYGYPSRTIRKPLFAEPKRLLYCNNQSQYRPTRLQKLKDQIPMIAMLIIGIGATLVSYLYGFFR